MKDFYEFVHNAKSDFEEFLKEKVSKRKKGNRFYQILTGGKLLRPVLCILTYRVCSGSNLNSEEILNTAVAVELGHAASLCHDDIIDNDLVRRGSDAAWVENGISEVLIMGHRMISWGFQISLSQGRKIADTFLNTWDTCTEGELEEVEVKNNRKKISPKTYSSIISKKTASLFSASAKAGSAVGHASLELQKVMEKYGALVGRTYQLADDLSEMPSKEDSELFKLLEKSNELEETPIDNYLKERMNESRKKAKKISQSEKIHNNKFKPLLSKLPDYFIKQKLEEKKNKMI
ncbi:hypothetical protein AKJ61_01350 [candidate division MSBL1 archaeon SCGC-AAA259B11]|uniref:Polyprenyl synthetase n=1 Tax=candidate division MSBL1 archaeon SCGC-AAA259B11 TaxID=1698260 RepID=A0A133U7I8_9EURY|nr:hypothetical protein AKJ61_01350 [candidate division MSBL1 archaeon SCGC-AAA259B11]